MRHPITKTAKYQGQNHHKSNGHTQDECVPQGKFHRLKPRKPSKVDHRCEDDDDDGGHDRSGRPGKQHQSHGKLKKKAKKPKPIWNEEEESISEEFDPDAPTVVAKQEKEEDDEASCKLHADPEAERNLIARLLKLGEIPHDCRTLRLEDFVDSDLADLYDAMCKVAPPITPKKILDGDIHKMLHFKLKDLQQLQKEDDPDVEIADLVDDMKRLMLHRKVTYLGNHADFLTIQYPEKLLFQAQELVEAARSRTAVPKDMEGMTLGELMDADVEVQYLIDGVLAAGQPIVFGAHSKTLKTLIALEMGISAGSATRFLGKFTVPEKVAVGIWSAESGQAVIKQAAANMCHYKGVNPHDVDLHLRFRVPQLSDSGSLALMQRDIVKHQMKLAIIDPAYLAMHTTKTAVQAGNVFMAGALLGEITKIGQETGCTIGLVHHFRKGGAVSYDSAATLEELAMAGFGEWARQWILLNRREKYKMDGYHKLWVNTGGSAGHGDTYALDIDEGKCPNRKWTIPLLIPENEFKQAEKEAKEHEQAVKEHQKQFSLTKQIELHLAACPEGVTATEIRKCANVSSAVLAPILASMLAHHQIVHVPVKKNNNQTYDGYTLAMNKDVAINEDTESGDKDGDSGDGD